jgi:hypothetical protein
MLSSSAQIPKPPLPQQLLLLPPLPLPWMQE